MVDEDDDDKENASVEGQAQDPLAQDPVAPTLADIMGALTR